MTIFNRSTVRVSSYIKKTLICILIGLLTTTITTFLMTRDIETLIGAPLFGFFLIPSVGIYFILDFFNKTQKAKFLAFLIPIIGMIALSSFGIWIDSQNASSDGSGEMAKLFVVNLMVGTILLLVVCRRITKIADR